MSISRVDSDDACLDGVVSGVRKLTGGVEGRDIMTISEEEDGGEGRPLCFAQLELDLIQSHRHCVQGVSRLRRLDLRLAMRSLVVASMSPGSSSLV
jgi:hypothetical protein